MSTTICDTPAGPATPAPAAGPPPPVTPPAPGERAYFRCHPLEATLSVAQCRANRGRLTLEQALAIPFDLPPWWVQPQPCRHCALAVEVEAGRVPFFTAAEVLAGHARPAPEAAPAGPARRGRPRSARPRKLR